MLIDSQHNNADIIKKAVRETHDGVRGGLIMVSPGGKPPLTPPKIMPVGVLAMLHSSGSMDDSRFRILSPVVHP